MSKKIGFTSRIMFPQSCIAPALRGQVVDNLVLASAADDDFVVTIPYPLSDDAQILPGDVLQLVVNDELVGGGKSSCLRKVTSFTSLSARAIGP